MNALAYIVGGVVLLVAIEAVERAFRAWMERPPPPPNDIIGDDTVDPVDERLRETMPPYLDPDDPDDRKAWQKARTEVLQQRGRHEQP